VGFCPCGLMSYGLLSVWAFVRIPVAAENYDLRMKKRFTVHGSRCIAEAETKDRVDKLDATVNWQDTDSTKTATCR